MMNVFYNALLCYQNYLRLKLLVSSVCSVTAFVSEWSNCSQKGLWSIPFVQRVCQVLISCFASFVSLSPTGLMAMSFLQQLLELIQAPECERRNWRLATLLRLKYQVAHWIFTAAKSLLFTKYHCLILRWVRIYTAFTYQLGILVNSCIRTPTLIILCKSVAHSKFSLCECENSKTTEIPNTSEQVCNFRVACSWTKGT